MLTSHFKNILLLLLAVSAICNPVSSLPKDGMGKKEAGRWAVQKSSTLRIIGSSNVNKFGCDITGYYQLDTIVSYEENAASKTVPLKGSLEIDVLSFNCHNKLLTSDLRKTLKAKEYPRLVIRFLSLERSPVFKNDKDVMKGWVEVELAGVCKRFEVCYSFEKKGNTLIQLNGKRCFSFADFKLLPPNKLGRLIVVNDRFEVNFNLLLDPLD